MLIMCICPLMCGWVLTPLFTRRCRYLSRGWRVCRWWSRAWLCWRLGFVMMGETPWLFMTFLALCFYFGFSTCMCSRCSHTCIPRIPYPVLSGLCPPPPGRDLLVYIAFSYFLITLTSHSRAFTYFANRAKIGHRVPQLNRIKMNKPLEIP